MERQFEVTSSFAIPQLYIKLLTLRPLAKHNEPPVEVVYEQGYSICTVEELPRRKRFVEIEQHCRRVLIVVEGWVLFHIKLLRSNLQLSVIATQG